MPSNPISLDSSFVPEEPLHPEGAAFFEQASEMLDGQAMAPAAVEATSSEGDAWLEKIATELYRSSSMLLGEGEDSIRLIENVVTNVDIPACSNHSEARHKACLLLATGAIGILRQSDSAAHATFAAPVDDSGPASCIEDDDLSAAGVTPAELEQMITGPERHRLRDWLEGLSVSLRVIFVLRAVAGLSSVEVAVLLAEHGGPAAQDWTPEAVRSSFRQALCSLASQLIHATATK